MPKMKTKSSAKKRFKVTGTGKLRREPGQLLGEAAVAVRIRDGRREVAADRRPRRAVVQRGPVDRGRVLDHLDRVARARGWCVLLCSYLLCFARHRFRIAIRSAVRIARRIAQLVERVLQLRQLDASSKPQALDGHSRQRLEQFHALHQSHKERQQT